MHAGVSQQRTGGAVAADPARGVGGLASRPVSGRVALIAAGAGRDALRRLGLQALTGALVWAASPGLGELYWLAGIALTPFLLSVHGLRPRPAAAWGLLGGWWYIVPGKWTTFANAIGAMSHGVVLEAASVVLFFLLFCLPFSALALLWSLAARWQRLALMPWAAGFGFAALIASLPTVFPYTPVAMISSVPLLIQLADLGGETLLLGLLLTVNFGFSRLLRMRRQGARAALVAILLPVFLVTAYGAWSLPHWQAVGTDSVSVLGLQAQWPNRSSDSLLLRDVARFRPLSAVELTRAGLAAQPQCELVVWPESSRVPSLPDRACARAAELSVEYATPILASCHDQDAQGRFFPVRLFTPQGLAGEHRKSRLVPVYEASLRRKPQDIQPGAGPDVLRAPGLPPLSPAICYEVHFRNDLRQAVKEGAQLFVHMANFSVFRSPRISRWDLAMTRLRAVETRRSVLRSVNAGVAGLVLPSGDWRSEVAPGKSGAACQTVPLHKQLTVFVRYGDSLFWTILVLLLVLLWASARYSTTAGGRQT